MPYRRTENRIQLSVRTKLAQGLLTQGHPTLKDSVWFGYSQQSYWQLFSPAISRPFRATDPGSAAHPREHEERRRDGHHPEPEEPVAGIAAPGEIAGDDEPAEKVQRARPCGPRKAVGRRRLRGEHRRLREPADPNAPRRRA